MKRGWAIGLVVISTMSFYSINLQAASQLTGFVKRNIDHLFIDTFNDGVQNSSEPDYRVIGWNSCTLAIQDDVDSKVNGGTGWRWASPEEVQMAIDDFKQLGADAFHFGGITVTAKNLPPEYSFVTGIRTYNEAAFRHWDKVLQLCNENGERVVMRVLSGHGVWGGVRAFAALRGKNEAQFFTDPTLKDDTKDLMRYILNRTNYYTGVKYKDDPAIVAFAMQTEGPSTKDADDWTKEMAAYFKSIDTNHLFLDGRYGPRPSLLEDPNIDIIDDHIYMNNPADWVTRCNKDMDACRGKKAYMIGEVGYSNYKILNPDNATNWAKFLDTVTRNGTSMVFIFRLIPHDRNGGLIGYDNIHRGNSNMSFAWPGSVLGDTYGERATMNLVREHAFEIRGLSTPLIDAPLAPVLLANSTTNAIRWRSSTGSNTYNIERSTNPNGPWTTIKDGFNDDVTPFTPYQDTSTMPGTSYYYRVEAVNSAGSSPPSNVVGPLVP